jgi:polyferredoxin
LSGFRFVLAQSRWFMRRQEGTMPASHRIFYLATFLAGALIGMGAAYAWAL